MSGTYNYSISYGKVGIPLYRVNAKPLAGIPSISESLFTGRTNILFTAAIDVEVFGDNFLAAYTQGDNSNLITTDSMKNFVLHHALTFTDSTLEDFLFLLGEQFLSTYPQMERLRLSGKELPFAEVLVPQADNASFIPSNVLFQHSHNDYGQASMEFTRVGERVIVTEHRCGRAGLQLLKVTGSSFIKFIRDDYTTLPERGDRPLFIFLDASWKYKDIGDICRCYIPSEQVRDVIQMVFHEFVSESIQQLLHKMGSRLLACFPQMAEVSFEAQNRTRDPIVESEVDPRVKVYSDPFPAYGSIKLTMSRSG